MTYRFPFRELHPDVVIWKVGCGFKAPLDDISGPREVKVPIAELKNRVKIFENQKFPVLFVSLLKCRGKKWSQVSGYSSPMLELRTKRKANAL